MATAAPAVAARLPPKYMYVSRILSFTTAGQILKTTCTYKMIMQ